MPTNIIAVIFLAMLAGCVAEPVCVELDREPHLMWLPGPLPMPVILPGQPPPVSIPGERIRERCGEHVRVRYEINI